MAREERDAPALTIGDIGSAPQLVPFTQQASPVIALLSVVAVTQLQLREAARRPDAKIPARTLVHVAYVRVLSGWRTGRPDPDMSVYDFTWRWPASAATRTARATARPAG